MLVIGIGNGNGNGNPRPTLDALVRRLRHESQPCMSSSPATKPCVSACIVISAARWSTIVCRLDEEHAVSARHRPYRPQAGVLFRAGTDQEAQRDWGTAVVDQRFGQSQRDLIRHVRRGRLVSRRGASRIRIGGRADRRSVQLACRPASTPCRRAPVVLVVRYK